MVVIPIISLKGGVGKSTVALNLADILATNHKVLLIDTDPQNSIASLLCKKATKGIGEVLRGEASLEDVMIKVELEKDFYIIPAGDFAITHPIEYEQIFTKDNLEKILKELEKFNFDYVIFDTAPRISKPIQTLLSIADYFFIVIVPDPASVASFDKFLKYLKENGFLKNFSVIVNKMEPSEISEDFYALIQAMTKNNILTTLPRDLKVLEAKGNCMPVSYYDPESAFVSFLKDAVYEMEKLFDLK